MTQHEITLRDVTEDDLAIFFEHQNDRIAFELAGFTPREEKPFFEHWAKILADPDKLKKSILVDGEVAGNIGSFTHEGIREVGYWIGRSYWGRGVASAALAQFLTMETQRPLYAHVVDHNVPSLRVLEKCGFVIVGEEEGVSPAGETLIEYELRLE